MFTWLRQQSYLFTTEQTAVLDVFSRSEGLGPLYADISEETGIPSLTIDDMYSEFFEIAYEILDARGETDDVLFANRAPR